MIISYITLLQIDKAHVVEVDDGITIKPIFVRLNVLELDVVAIITKVSNDFDIVVIGLNFLYFFGFVIFIFEASNHFFNVVDMVIETIYIFFLIFVANHCFIMVLRDIIFLFFGSLT